MIKIIPKTLFGNVWMDIPDRQVPRGADPNLIRNVAWENKLAIIPRKLKLLLKKISIFFSRLIKYNYPLSMNINIIALCIV